MFRRNPWACLPNPQLADQLASPTQAVTDNADTPSRQFCRQEHAQIASFYNGDATFKTDQQENVGASLSPSIDARAGGRNCSNRASAMLQIELPGGGRSFA